MDTKNLGRVAALLLAVAVFAAPSCKPKTAAAAVTMNEMLGTPTTLSVVGSWTTSTVTNPTGPIVDSVVWRKGSLPNRTLIKTRVGTTLSDTITLNPRATLGGVDSVWLLHCSVYRPNGNVACGPDSLRVFPNKDKQVPSTSLITLFDTL